MSQDRLHHYTTASGLQGILKTQSLWATHFGHTNDETELRWAENILVQAIHPIHTKTLPLVTQKKLPDSIIDESILKKMGGWEYYAQFEANRRIKLRYRILDEQFEGAYITSFCSVKENGLLSMWRAYGTDGGYAIELEKSDLAELWKKECDYHVYMDIPRNQPLKVLYPENQSPPELKAQIAAFVKAEELYYENFLAGLPEPRQESAENDLPNFLECISRIKHPGFSEEQEFRFVMIPTTLTQEYIKFCEENGTSIKEKVPVKNYVKNGKLIPYIDLFSHQKTNDQKFRLPIKRIIVGPCRDRESRKEALEIHLNQINMSYVEVLVSNIPYVG